MGVKKQLTWLASGFVIAALTLGLTFRPQASATVPGVNYLVDQNTSGATPNQYSEFYSPYLVSGNGRYIAFTSYGTDIVSGSTSYSHIYVRDTVANTTTQEDFSSSGTQADSSGKAIAISNDGRYVLFNSYATNLHSFTLSSAERTYLRDRTSGTTTLVSNGPGAGMSSDGKYVMLTWTSIPGGASYTKKQVLVKNLQTNQWQNASTDSSGNAGNQDSTGMGTNCSGNVVAFTSAATNLPGNSSVTGGNVNLFIGVLGWNGIENLTNITGQTSGTSIGNAQVSCNGNEVVYAIGTSYPSTPHTYKYNRLTGIVSEVGKSSSGTSVKSSQASISDDGRFVAFMSDAANVDSAYTSTNASGYSDVYIRDTKNNTTQLVTFNSSGSRLGGGQGYVSISPDGSRVAYLYNTNSSMTVFQLISGVYSTHGRGDVYASTTGF